MSDLILVSREDTIAVLRLNRPDVLNAINMEILSGLATLCEELDADESIRCIVITGSDKAFAAGSDIKGNFAGKGVIELHQLDFPRQWARFTRIKTPLIAAVSGYCLGGGCELAMCCDVILASETAQFAQPEVNIGIMTGAGASQRLTRAVGKYVANDMILTGRYVKADEAKTIGLAARVFPAATFM